MQEKIQQEIQKQLDRIEAEEHVRILHCVESGSRAWGFASPDSDYDVRFVYLRRGEDYLRLDQKRDVIEWKLDEVYDISGWDLQKTLRLLHRSNPTVFEWDASPVVYRTTPEWEQVRTLLPDYFQQRTGMHHYLNTAKHTAKAYLRTEQVRLKKYFYVLRPLLACRYITEYQSAPPVAFSALAEAVLAPEMRPLVEDLVARKMQTPEVGTGEHIPALDAYLQTLTAQAEQAITALPAGPGRDWAPLNALFIRLLKGEDPLV